MVWLSIESVLNVMSFINVWSMHVVGNLSEVI